MLTHGRLWYVPPILAAGMSEITPIVLTGGDYELAKALHRALSIMKRIRWRSVDGAASTRPMENNFGAPVYKNGDCVPWREAQVGDVEMCVEVVDALCRGREGG